jgi:hypothetical protein
VHPNAVHRLVERGDLTATVLRTGKDETWLVDPEAVARRLRPPCREAPAQPSVDAAATASPTAVDAPMREMAANPAAESAESRTGGGLPAMVDLSLDRAQALERYTHGLLAPLVDLLREREAAIERREAIVREQAERIGRLEQEVEFLRLQVARAGDLEATASRQESGVAPPAEGVADAPSESPAVEPPVGELDAAPNQRAELDPFATAEIAVRELQQALAARAPQQRPEATDIGGADEVTDTQEADLAELAPPTSAGGAVMAVPAPVSSQPRQQEAWPGPQSVIGPAAAAALRQPPRREAREMGWRSWRWWRFW